VEFNKIVIEKLNGVEMYKERIFTCPRCNNIVRTGDKYGTDYTRYCRKCKAKFKVYGECGKCDKKKDLTWCHRCQSYECDDCHYSCSMTS